MAETKTPGEKKASRKPRARRQAKATERIHCGIVMPISATPECPASHWSDVLAVIREALEDGGFSGRLVSDADETRVIQSKIIQSLYTDEIVVCDVSCRNPNVMFELGIRIAFDRPTVVIKDNETAFSFDSAPLEHLLYPRNLAYREICTFKLELAKKVRHTLEASKEPSYQSFLRTFAAPYVFAGKLESKEVSSAEFMTAQFERIFQELADLKEANARSSSSDPEFVKCLILGCSRGAMPSAVVCLPHLLEKGASLTAADKAMLKSAISAFLQTMPYYDREILKLRSGIGDGYLYTVDECAHIFKMTPADIRESDARSREALSWLGDEGLKVLYPPNRIKGRKPPEPRYFG